MVNASTSKTLKLGELSLLAFLQVLDLGIIDQMVLEL